MSLLDVDENTLKHYLMAGHGRGYENSLCSCCREDVVSKMIERNVFPRYYRLECMHDSNLDIRELAKTVVEDEVTDKG